jgi:PTS system mannose-specific IIB component/fructoselysine and glucoselysine-specific PTS system IIB component
MPIVLYRIDDRLVHGQVVIGWGRQLGVAFIVLVDEAVAASKWEQDLYRMGVPPDMELHFATVADFARGAAGWRSDPRTGIVITADIGTMAAICQAAPPVPQVNLGGVHHKPGRRERRPYVYLTDEEFGALERLEREGTEVRAQDVPGTVPVPLAALR